MDVLWLLDMEWKMLTQALIEKISGRTAVIECFEITLTQNKEKDPLIFSGPGSLYFDSDKRLKLKFYSKETTSSSSKMINFYFDHRVGVIPEDDYFALSATDTRGKCWTNNRVLILNGYDATPSGTVLDISLESVRSQSNLKSEASSNEAMIIALGKFRLPFTAYVSREDGSQELAKLAFNHGSRSVEIIQKEHSLNIRVLDKKLPITFEALFYLLEGLSIGIGQLTEPSLIVAVNGQCYEIFVKGKIPSKRSDVAQPVINIFEHRNEELSTFLCNYVECRTIEHRHMVNYWHRLNQIPYINTEAAALVLCVNIEGMIKNYFSQDRNLDPKIIAEINDTRTIIKKTDLPPEGRKAILQFLGSMKERSVASILSEMGAESAIEMCQVQSWKDLRHIIAHADNKVSDSSYFEVFVQDLQNCLTLFSRLIKLCVMKRSNDRLIAAQPLKVP